MVSLANGYWPVVVVAGVLAFANVSAVAAENSTSGSATEAAAATSGHHARHHAHHGSGKRSEKHVVRSVAPERRKPAAADRADKAADDVGLPVRVANARAEVADADIGAPAGVPSAQAAPAPAAPAPSPAADAAPAPDAAVVAADEGIAVERSAAPDKPSGKILRPVPSTPYLSNAASEDTWSQTSLIGKVFIVLGGCLTLASAARMFVA